jgi:hypothetical protein
MTNCEAIRHGNWTLAIEPIRALMNGAKGADWTNYNRSLMQSCDGLRTLMEDAREGLIR